ncbi:hypothetical protein HDV00_012461 [Rhizophlyctis rosea]|nr:hypothetical protein HDV00_012461 [Rhizophlyctis rosea]
MADPPPSDSPHCPHSSDPLDNLQDDQPTKVKYFGAPIRHFLSICVRKQPLITLCTAYGLSICVVLACISLPLMVPQPTETDPDKVKVVWWRYGTILMGFYLASTSALVLTMWHSMTPWLLPTSWLDVLWVMFMSVAPAWSLNIGMRYVPNYGIKIVENKLFPTLCVLVGLVPGTIEWMRRNVMMHRRLERESRESGGGMGGVPADGDGLAKADDKGVEMGLEPLAAPILQTMRIEDDIETGSIASSNGGGGEGEGEISSGVPFMRSRQGSTTGSELTTREDDDYPSDDQIQQRIDDFEKRQPPNSGRSMPRSLKPPSSTNSPKLGKVARPLQVVTPTPPTAVVTTPVPLSPQTTPYPSNSRPSIMSEQPTFERRESTEGSYQPRGRSPSVASRRITGGSMHTNASLQRDKERGSNPRPTAPAAALTSIASSAPKIAETLACFTDDDDIARLRSHVVADGSRSSKDSIRQKKKTRAEGSSLSNPVQFPSGSRSMSVFMSKAGSRGFRAGSGLDMVLSGSNPEVDIGPPQHPPANHSKSNDAKSINVSSPHNGLPTQNGTSDITNHSIHLSANDRTTSSITPKPTSLLAAHDFNDHGDQTLQRNLSAGARNVSRWTLRGRDIVPMPLRQMQWIVACVCIAAMTFFIGQRVFWVTVKFSPIWYRLVRKLPQIAFGAGKRRADTPSAEDDEDDEEDIQESEEVFDGREHGRVEGNATGLREGVHTGGPTKHEKDDGEDVRTQNGLRQENEGAVGNHFEKREDDMEAGHLIRSKSKAANDPQRPDQNTAPLWAHIGVTLLLSQGPCSAAADISSLPPSTTPNPTTTTPPTEEDVTKSPEYKLYILSQCRFVGLGTTAQFITMIAFLAWMPTIRRGYNNPMYITLTPRYLPEERYTHVMYDSMASFVAEIVAILVSNYFIGRMTGRSIWREYVRFMTRHPRVLVCVCVTSVHCLMDVIVALCFVDIVDV